MRARRLIGWLLSLGLVPLFAACTPEELIAARDAENPNDPSIAQRPVEPLVAQRLHGSNYRQKIVETGFSGNGHAQSWDGRLFIGRVPLPGDGGWAVQVFRPENVLRDVDGAADFQRQHATQNAITRKSAAVSIALESTNNAAMIAGSLNALAIVPHPSPSNPSLVGHPTFTYDIHHNPFRSDDLGNYDAAGAYETYELLVYATDYTTPRRTVSLDVRVVIANPRTATASVHGHQILRTAETLRDTSGNQLIGIEPTSTFDGRLIVVHDGGRMKYSFNPTPGAVLGWSPLRTVADMHHVDAQTDVDGEMFAQRYPIARKPLQDHNGTPYQQGEGVWGAYPWINLDGTDLAFQATIAGIPGTPSLARRGGFSLVGATTRYQSVHVDGPINDSRLGNFSGGTKLFVSSPGMLPGFWFPFLDRVNEQGFAIPYSTAKPVFPFYHSNGGEYFEVPLEDALDGRYLSVLRMTESIRRDSSFDVGLTPDTSGNLAHGRLLAGAAFPIEAGLGDVNLDPGLGRSVLFGGGAYVQIDDNPVFDRIEDEFSVELFFQQRGALDVFNPLAQREGAFFFLLLGSGELVGQVTLERTLPVATVGAPREYLVRRQKFLTPLVPATIVQNEYTHLALTVAILPDNTLRQRIYQDGVLLTEQLTPLGRGRSKLVENAKPILIGPRLATAVAANAISLDDVKLSYVERDQDHIRDSAYQTGLVDSTFDVASIPAPEIALGQQLFFDPSLSGDGTMSCATCHDPALFFTDGLALPLGGGTRNTPTVFGRAHTATQFYDGRASSLEEQALSPILNPLEMDNTEAGLLQTLAGDPGYVASFQSVYGSAPTVELATQALANFQRSLVPPPTPFDDFQAGTTTALTDSELRGLELFSTKARCTACHNGETFTDELFHNTGFVDLLEVPVLDVGRGGARFKTPTLRGIGQTAPYLHDGSIPTLEEMVELYDQGGLLQGGADVEVQRLGLTQGEKDDLVAFLRTL